jgi:hypothetical protein
VAATSRAARARHHLAPAEGAEVSGYLARLTVTVNDLAARLNALQAALAAPARASTASGRNVAPGLATQGAGPWR